MGFCYCNVYSRCVVIADAAEGQTLRLIHGYCLRVRCVIKKYSECLNKNYYIAINPHQNTSLSLRTHLPHRSCHFEEVLEVLFRECL